MKFELVTLAIWWEGTAAFFWQGHCKCWVDSKCRKGRFVVAQTMKVGAEQGSATSLGRWWR